jgi:cation:H+ antiporter
MHTVTSLALVALAGAPAFVLRASGWPVPVELATLLYGFGVIAAAFAMSWGAEAAEHDIPRSLALLTVALLAVLPEYAVDIIFAWKAGQDPTFTAYAAANMTGSNRLLLGLGWPTVAVTTWFVSRERIVHLDRGSVPGLVFLGAATLYSFAVPFKATISLIDSVVLGSIFIAYAVMAARAEVVEPDLVGPAATIGALSVWSRRAAVLALFAYAAAAIFTAAEPFAEGLVATGRKLRVDEFLLVQWLAPLASEAPEFLVAVLLALRGKAVAALGLLVSSKVNQWTLLVGSLPIAYSFGSGHLAALPLDQRQVAEVLLTAAQSLFGLGVLASLSLSLKESALLAGLFVAQLVSSGFLRETLHRADAADAELVAFAALYVALGLGALIMARHRIAGIVRRATPP